MTQRLPTLGADLRALLALAAIALVPGCMTSTRLSTILGEDGQSVPPARERNVPEPGLDAPTGDGESLLSMEEFFLHRVAYPTGRFEPSWYVEAVEEDRLVERALPEGEIRDAQSLALATLPLDPSRFTSLGPKPLQSDGCLSCYSYGRVAGRVNAIAIDPVTPSVAYIGSNGGGVWKTTSCCTAATVWAPVTDDPLLSTIAIGDITIDPNDHNTVYAGTGDLRYGSWSFGAAGVLKSTDQGATWSVLGAEVFAPPYDQPSGSFPQNQAIGKVRVDPNDGNRLAVGTKTGLFLSWDAGASWTGPCVTNPFGSQRQDVTGLILRDVGSATQIYAFVGARGFATAVQSNLDQNGANGVYRALLPETGCPTGWETLSRSNNGWPAETASGLPVNTATGAGNKLGRLEAAIAPSNPDVIYVQAQAILASGGTQRGGQLGVWRTTDGGATWTQRSGPAGLTGCSGDYGQNWYDQAIAVDPNNPNVVYLGTVDIFRSTDGGAIFTNLTCGYAGGTTVHVDQHALAFLPGSSRTLLAGNDGGVYVTTNAGWITPVFTQLNDTLPTLEMYSGDITANFATTDGQPGINAGMQDNGSAVYVWSPGDPAAPMWQLRRGGDGMFARIEPVLGQRWYQESQNGSLGVSTTGPFGAQVSASGPWSSDRLSFIFPYEIQKFGCPPTGCTHMIAGSYRVYESVNGAIGSTSSSRWHVNSGDLTKGTLADRSFINQLNYAPSDATRAIVGTNDGNVQMGFNLGQGVANTASWVNVTGGNAVLPNRPILDVFQDPSDPLIGYAAVGGFDQNTPATPGHVFQVACTAGCTSFVWRNVSGNLPNIPANSIIVNPNYRQQLFVGTDWGLYFTNDADVAVPVWHRFQDGLPNAMIWDMTIDTGATALAVWTRSRGAFAWPLPSSPHLLGAIEDDPASAPLRVTKSVSDPSRVDLSWGTGCGGATTGYAVYEGTIGSWYSHGVLNGLCGVETLEVANQLPGAGDRYYLLAPVSISTEGSLGADSSGAEIPAGSPACRPARDLTRCW